ncbi:phage tail tape measure protein [Rhizobium panacihumi]|uniref:phage tail tape measure protein n=1 Tax=Rhizobium panacihumi TaxID=2008450 RepID=UPI003D7A89E9
MSVRDAVLRLKLIDGVTGPAKAAALAIKTVSGAVTAFNARAAAANAAFQGQAFQAVAIGAAMLQPIRAAARLEDAMADVRKVSDLSDSQLQRLRGTLIQLSRETPMAADELAGLAAELAAAGVPTSDLEGMTKLVARAGTAFGITGQQAGENLGKIRAALQLTTAQTERYADVVNALSDATASSAPDLLDFSRRVGSMGEQYGFSIDQTLAIGSAMISAGATAEQASTGFQAVGRALVKGNAATSTQDKAYKRLGLTSKNVAKSMAKDALGTTQDVLARIRKLPDWERASVVNQLFGDEGRTFLPLIENTGLLADSLKVLADEGKISGSVLREFETRINTTSGKAKQLRNRVMAAGIAFGNALLPSIRDTADALGPLVDRTSKFIESNEEMVAKVAKVGLGLAATRLAMTGLRAGMFALLRPTNLLLAGLGYLAYQNFDSISAALTDLKALATDLAGTKFVQSFLEGAGSALNTMGEGAQKVVAALREMSAEGGALRAWLDSVDGAGWGQTLGAVAVGLGAVAASAALLGPILRPVGALVRLIARLAKVSGGVKATAAALDQVNASATRAQGIRRPGIWSMAFGALGAIDLVNNIPSDKDELAAFMEENRKRSEGWNQWLEKNVGSPRSWLGLDKPSEPAPVVDRQKAGVERDNLAQQTKGWPLAAQLAMNEFVSAIMQGGAEGEAKAATAAQAIKEQLQINGSLSLDTSQLDGAIAKARQYATTLRGSSAPAASAEPIAGARAKGGPVTGGRPYLVGERGPEIFTPGRSGGIVPNHQIGGRSGPVTVHAPITLSFHGSTENDVRRIAREAARSMVEGITNGLDRQLNRAAQTAFVNGSYGDK